MVEGLRGSGDNVRDITSWKEAVGVMEGLRIKVMDKDGKGKDKESEGVRTICREPQRS